MNRHQRRKRKHTDVGNYIKYLERENKRLQALCDDQEQMLRTEQDSNDGSRLYTEAEVQKMVSDARNEGWDKAWNAFQQYLDPFFRELIIISGVLGQIIGVAMAGFGDLPRKQLKPLRGKLWNYLSNLDLTTARASEFISDIELVTDMTFPKEVSEATRLYYSGKDPNGTNLRTLAAQQNDTIAYGMQLRSESGPGRDHNPMINLFCSKAKLLRDTADMTWNEIWNLFLTTNEQDELDFLEDWSLEALQKAYNRRYSKKGVPQLIGET